MQQTSVIGKGLESTLFSAVPFSAEVEDAMFSFEFLDLSTESLFEGNVPYSQR